MSQYKRTLKIDEAETLAKISKAQEREAILITLYETTINTIKPQDGKPISKRIETAVKKALPDWSVSLNRDYSDRLHIYQSAWDNPAYNPEYDYQHGFDIYLGKTFEGNLDLARMMECYPYKRTRAAWEADGRNLGDLAFDCSTRKELIQDIAAWNMACETLEALNKKHEHDDSPVKYLFDWNY